MDSQLQPNTCHQRHTSGHLWIVVPVLMGAAFTLAGCAEMGRSTKTVRQDVPSPVPIAQTLPQTGNIHHPKAHALVERAINEYRSGLLKESLASLRDARKIDPYYVLTYELEANVALDAGEKERCTEALQAALAANPGSARLQNAIGRLLVSESAWQTGLEALQRAILLEPRNTRYSRDLAAAHFGHGEIDEAKRTLLKAIDSNPLDDSLPLALARLCESTGYWEAAAFYYQVMLEHRPEDLMAHRQRARCLYHDGDYQTAFDEFSWCVRKNVNNLSLAEYVEFGDACLHLTNYEVGGLVFDEVSRRSQIRLRDVELLRALCALQEGEVDRANYLATQAAEYWPNDETLNDVLALCNVSCPDAIDAPIQQAVFECVDE
jgi:tetratricopeptide (TPR) repeat protein